MGCFSGTLHCSASDQNGEILNVCNRFCFEPVGHSDAFRLPFLAKVRHERGRRWAKWFRISSGYCRACTTCGLQSKMFGQADSELPEQRLLLGCRLGDPPQPDLAAIGSGQNDVGAL